MNSRKLALVPLSLVTFLLLGPFLWTTVLSFRRSHEIFANPYGLPIPFRIDNYVYALESGFLTNILNSALVVGSALVIVTAMTTMAAYVFGRARFAFPGRSLVFVAIFLSMFFPPQVTVLSLFQLAVGYGLYNSLWALILVYPAGAIAFNTYLLRAFFAQIPTDIEDAARIDGCGDWHLFWRVMFPIARPAIATTIIFNFNGFWNEFLYALTPCHQARARHGSSRLVPLGRRELPGRRRSRGRRRHLDGSDCDPRRLAVRTVHARHVGRRGQGIANAGRTSPW